MSPAAPHLAYRPDIDGLRAIAVLSVVLFHAFPDFLKGGFIGVDVFFVISGYLISRIVLEGLQGNRFSFTDFYARRIRRIFPALTLVLLASFMAGWLTLPPGDYAQLGKHMAAGAGFVSNLALWAEAGYFDASADTKPLLHLWSLAIEEQFYILWPLVLWLCFRFRFNRFPVIAALAALSFALNLYGVGPDPVATFYAPYTRFWEILCGSGLGWYAIRRQNTAMTQAKGVPGHPGFAAHLFSVMGIALLIIGFGVIDKNSGFPGVWAAIPVLGAVLIILAGPQAWVNRHVLSTKALVWFGLISFPLYLWHWPLLTFARLAEGGPPAAWVRWVLVAASVVLAWLTWRFIEQPIRHKSRPGVTTPILVALLMGCGVLGFKTWVDGGYPGRFPEAVRALADYHYDYREAYREGRCFLEPDQNYTHFATCETPHVPGAKSLFLWGDSHAAHLYPGYKHVYGGTRNIIQRNASGCPPILGVDIESRRHCRAINDHVMGLIKSNLPDKVVLAAIWTDYDLTALGNTIKWLKAAGVNDIDLVGPVPQWQDGLPLQLYRQFRRSILHVMPTRMTEGLKDSVAETDKTLKARAETLGVRYISAYDALCNPDGCLTRLGDAADDLTAWDYGHLTTKGSEFLVSSFPP